MGLKDRFSPDCETVEPSVIVPENPLRLVRVIVLLLEDTPRITPTDTGLEVMLKPGMVTATETVVVFVDEPLAPLTVTV